VDIAPESDLIDGIAPASTSMISTRLERFSYRFAEQVLNSKLAIKQEVEAIQSAANLLHVMGKMGHV